MRRAALPIAAALGGMLLPAGCYLALQFGEPGMRGWGIPMATDIAFVVGCMAILGRRVPRGLRVMLLSLAIADDIGAILVIAIGYTDNLDFTWLIWGLVGLAIVFACARLGIRSFAMYVICGVFIWYAFHESKVHATIAGVLLGLMTPARVYLSPSLFAELMARVSGIDQAEWESDHHRAAKLRQFQWATRETISPLEYLENTLHPWVSFVIMPLFALANAGVRFQPSYLASGTALAVMLGLIVGKPVGITLFSWLAVRSHMASLPRGVGWRHVVAGGCLSGIGFTMAIFIAGLAFESSPQLLDVAKVGVIVASVASALLGTGLLLAARPESDLAGGPPEV
jgi:NhaA family Na+:H+ antiporter